MGRRKLIMPLLKCLKDDARKHVLRTANLLQVTNPDDIVNSLRRKVYGELIDRFFAAAEALLDYKMDKDPSVLDIEDHLAKVDQLRRDLELLMKDPSYFSGFYALRT